MLYYVNLNVADEHEHYSIAHAMFSFQHELYVE